MNEYPVAKFVDGTRTENFYVVSTSRTAATALIYKMCNGLPGEIVYGASGFTVIIDGGKPRILTTYAVMDHDYTDHVFKRNRDALLLPTR